MTSSNDIEQLFRNNYAAMYKLAFRLMHERETAKDIVHDIFSSLIAYDTVKDITAGYLMMAVRKNCLQRMRNLTIRNRLKKLYAIDLDEIEEEEWPDEESIGKIRSVLKNQLSEACRRVISMRFDNNMSYKEISEELRISETAVYKHLRHGLNVLRQNIITNER